MNYEDFKAELKKELEEICGADSKVCIHSVTKPNDLILDALNICKADSNIAPNIYLRPVYDFCLNSRISVKETARAVLNMNEDMIKSAVNTPINEIENIYDYDWVRDRLIIKIINRDRSPELLKRLVSLPFLDFAVTFAVLTVQGTEKGIVRVTEQMAERWHKEACELYGDAIRNMEKINFRMENLIDTIESMSNQLNGGIGKDEFKESQKFDMPVPLNTIFDESMANGSAILLLDDKLKNFADELDGDLVILPSSVNELICMKDMKELDYSNLKEIVSSINKTFVYEDEVLSDNIYRFSREEQSLSIIAC